MSIPPFIQNRAVLLRLCCAAACLPSLVTAAEPTPVKITRVTRADVVRYVSLPGTLRANQQAVRPGDEAWAPWRAHSLNFDREHGGEKGEPWRRMFMSDLATAFAVLALL